MANGSDGDHDTDQPVGDNWFTVEEYQDAIIKLGSAITPLHRRMLVAHAEAPECMLSVRQLAAAGGYTPAQMGRDIMASRITPNQIAAAQQLSREWKPKAK